jgi:hypothetical protein
MFIVVGEGRSRRFFLTQETAAQSAQSADRHGLTWAVNFAP